MVSRLENGSSSSSTAGRVTRALARATRCGLAAGQAGRQAVAEAGQVDQGQGLGDPGPAPLGPRQAVADVAGHGQVGEQGAVLEHHADPAPLGGDEGPGGGQVPAVQADLAGVGPLQPGDAAQQGRLAAAAGAEQGHHPAGRDPQPGLVEDQGVPEGLAQALDGQRAGRCGLRHA